jgi:predicted HicB family RNase H-like nuclease
MAKTTVETTARLPKSVHTKWKKFAKINHKSMNDVVIELIKAIK